MRVFDGEPPLTVELDTSSLDKQRHSLRGISQMVVLGSSWWGW